MAGFLALISLTVETEPLLDQDRHSRGRDDGFSLLTQWVVAKIFCNASMLRVKIGSLSIFFTGGSNL